MTASDSAISINGRVIDCLYSSVKLDAVTNMGYLL
jgi:hypothetical protein